MTGRPAWLAWHGVHLMLLSGGEQKIQTFLIWGRDRLTHGRRKRADSGQQTARAKRTRRAFVG